VTGLHTEFNNIITKQ